MNKLVAVVNNTVIRKTMDGRIVNWCGTQIDSNGNWGLSPCEITFSEGCTLEDATYILSVVCGQ